MEKFNRHWMLKYSENRHNLLVLCQENRDRESFMNLRIFEVSYPYKYEGRQIRYLLYSGITTLPEGCIAEVLNRKKKQFLFDYYQLDKFLKNEQKEN